MAVTVLEQAATTHLTTLDRVKNELGITDTTDDDNIIRWISDASSLIAKECGRVFGREKVTETLPGSGGVLLGLSRAPLVTIHELYEDSNLLVEGTDFAVEERESSALYKPSGWGKSGGMRAWGVEAFSSGYILPGAAATMRYIVTYSAGWLLPGEQNPFVAPGPNDIQNLPGALEIACLETVKYWYNEREGAAGGGQPSSIQVGQLRVSGTSGGQDGGNATTKGLPQSIFGYLRLYKRIL